jgi:hypothetical protein
MSLPKMLTYPLCILLLSVLAEFTFAQESPEYGADVSFPIHHLTLHEGPLGNRNNLYKEFMEGCRKHYGRKSKSCDEGEIDRLEMSLRQPQSMVVRCYSLITLFNPNASYFSLWNRITQQRAL